jgi:NAD+-dependent secondary alcohol dehydrogenase Adh1
MKAMSAATVIVVDQNEKALDLAKSIGADSTVLADKDGNFVSQVLALTSGGKGAEAVVDFVAESGSTKTGVKMLRQAGNYYVVGYGENLDIPTIDIISSEINFIGNLVGSFADLEDLMVLAAQGRVKLYTSEYKMEEFQKAVDDLIAGRVRGRAILIP